MVVMTLSADQLDTLRHMLGINKPADKHPKPYRDYYCADPGDAKMLELAALGVVVRYSQRYGYDWYSTTDAGRAAAIESHKTIRLSKSKRLYSRYLNVSDAWPDLTFKKFLVDPQFAKTRKES